MMEIQRNRLSLIGCGAVAEQFHIPALKKLGVIPNVFVDPNIERASVFAKKYKGYAVSNYSEVIEKFDKAIISVPHFLHKSIGVDLLEKGKHVFIEKPLANTVEECDAIIQSVNNSVLSVGLFRRFLNGTKWLKGLIESGDLGDIEEFHVREGGPYTWPVKTDSFWKKEKSGGGVLIDTGAHTLDQLCWWLDEMDVVSYSDNAYGGGESDCIISLKTKSGGEGTVELSRTRNIGCYAIFKGSKGSIKIGLLNNSIAADTPSLQNTMYNGIDLKTCKPQPYVELFQLQLKAWLNAINKESGDIVSGLSAKKSVELIEQCYLNRTQWNLPWVTKAKR